MSAENQKDETRKRKIMDYVKELETKGSHKNSSIELLKSAAVTGLGIFAGKYLGRKSLIGGAAVAYIGYYADVPKLTQFGVSVMATSGFLITEKGIFGTEVNGIEGFKEQAKAVTASLKHGLYLDKIFKTKDGTKEQGTGELGGEVQYFKYPNNELNVGSLEAIEREIERSGERFAERQQFNGNNEDFSGVEERLY